MKAWVRQILPPPVRTLWPLSRLLFRLIDQSTRNWLLLDRARNRAQNNIRFRRVIVWSRFRSVDQSRSENMTGIFHAPFSSFMCCVLLCVVGLPPFIFEWVWPDWGGCPGSLLRPEIEVGGIIISTRIEFAGGLNSLKREEGLRQGNFKLATLVRTNRRSP